MSVYKPSKSRLWLYDFVHKGRRFHGSTGQVTRRAAEAVERKLRQDAGLGLLGEAARLSLDQALLKWWSEVGQHRKDAKSLENRLEQLVKALDPTLRLAEIDQTAVAAAIEVRRGMTYRRSPKKNAKAYLPSNATVNRDMLDSLRPILSRARTHWGARGLPAIDWRTLRLPEPREIVRIYSDAERARWLAECRAGTALALELMLDYGLRFSELFFPLSAYEPDGPRLAWRKGRKRDIPHTVPLPPRHAAEIAARVGRARAAKLEHIWFVEVIDEVTKEVVLQAIPPGGLEARLSSAANRARIPDGRRIHGARHHAGSTFLRKTGGNLKLTQRLLGHADIASTMRYVHVLEDDLREALEETPARAPASKRPGFATVRRKRSG